MDFLSESKARGEGNVDLGFDFDASQWAGWNRKKKRKKKLIVGGEAKKE